MTPEEQRKLREHWEREAAKHPAWMTFVNIEEERQKKLTSLRQAFLDAYYKANPQERRKRK